MGVNLITKRKFFWYYKRKIVVLRLNYLRGMYAIVKINGFQYKVSANQYVYVNRIHQTEGSNITLNEVMLVDNGSVQVGKPYLNGVTVSATILNHLKGDKVIVFKKKRRKGYKVKKGHRQYLTKLQINSINI